MITNGKGDRGKLDSTLAAMFSNMDYRADYLFYAHMIGLCSIKIDKNLPAAAGVAFVMDHYNLYINPEGKSIPVSEIPKDFDMSQIKKEDYCTVNGEKHVKIIPGFDDYPLVQRLAILKHEMLHILYGHINRMEDRAHLPWNYATDASLNQHIDPAHLNSNWIMPKTISKIAKTKAEDNKSAEYYYELMKQNSPDQCPQCGGSGKVPDGSQGGQSGQQPQNGQGDKKEDQNGSGGQGQEENKDGHGDSDGDGHGDGTKPCDCCHGNGSSNSNGQPDTHSTWKQSTGDPDLQKDMTKKMIERSQQETIKSRGNVPSECGDWLSLHTVKSQVSWRRVLRGIVGNKRIGHRPTIKRRDRRFPLREDLRGKTKDRTFNLLVVWDVSGSMSDRAGILTLGEVAHICDITKAELDLIQIDTVAYSPEKFSKKTKAMTRKGSGGTDLHHALAMADKHNLDYQAIVVLTDGGLSTHDVEQFGLTGKKVIWLIESEGSIMAGMNSGKMKAFKLEAPE